MKVPPAFMLPRLRAGSDEPLTLHDEWPDGRSAYCVICQRHLAVLYWVNGNGPYCAEHKPTHRC